MTMNFEEYFWTHLVDNIVWIFIALIIAIILVAIFEQFFDVKLKNPMEGFYFGTQNPIGKVPIMRNPVGKIPVMKNPMRRVK
jgi:hypothetical protein